MKLSSTLSALITSVILFQGCTSSDESTTTNKTNTQNSNKYEMLVKGKTTLASGYRVVSKATVCLDANHNNSCENSEEQTYTDANGNYSLSLINGIANGDTLVVIGGVSVLPLSNKNSFTFKKIYNDAEASQNINIISDMVSNEVNIGLSYDEAVNKISTTYNFSKKSLLSNPLDNVDDVVGEAYFRFISALEVDTLSKSSVKQQNKFFDDNTTYLPSVDEVSETLSEYSGVFDNFFISLKNFYGRALGVLGLDDIDENLESNISNIGGKLFFIPVPLTKNELVGSWYVSSKGDKSCVYVSEYNNVTTFGQDGNLTTSRLILDGNLSNIKSVEFEYSLFSSDKVLIQSFTAGHIFSGIYVSNSEDVVGTKIASLKKCKEKLGLTN